MNARPAASKKPNAKKEAAPATLIRELAARMARIARDLRDAALVALNSPRESKLEAWRKAFADELSPSPAQGGCKADFADVFAQTVACGFFAAYCCGDEKPFTSAGVSESLPATSPLLCGLFAFLAGPDIQEEPYCRFVEDMARLLARADRERVLGSAGGRERDCDPVIHFYESFLAAYNSKLREKRGVYYTPAPVASWLVRSADAVVRERFGIPTGLADMGRKGEVGANRKNPGVRILDPACGTGAFLCEAVSLIRDRLKDEGHSDAWSAFVRENLLPRLFGFELLAAPYAVAYFTLGMRLAGRDLPEMERLPWRYEFSDVDRLGLYLANTLESEGHTFGSPGLGQGLPGGGQAPPVLVILGNPPYAGHSANSGGRGEDGGKSFIGRLIDDYRQVDGQPLGEANPKWLQDDYVKFIRWAQWKLDNAGEGVVAFVTNHGYLDNPTFRGMRWSLMRSFDEIYVYDLHGNARKKEKSPDGSPDRNVFDIQQGVALAVFVKRKASGRKAPARVFHAEIYGERQAKYECLSGTDILSVDWKELCPVEPAFLFVPRDDDLSAEYSEGESVTKTFPAYSVGMATARDTLAVHFTPEELWNAINEFAGLTPEEARAAFALGKDSDDWQVALAQDDIRQSGPDKRHIRKILYRPFDVRYTYYTGKTKGFICRPRARIMNRMTGGNIGLIVGRSGAAANIEAWETAFISRHPIDLNIFRRGGGALFPFRPGGGEALDQLEGAVPDKNGDKNRLFYYTYAILHSDTYRQRYHEFLQKDFPRIPVARDKVLFRRLADLGEELAGYHTLEHPALFDAGRLITGYPVTGAVGRADRVEKGWPKYDGQGTVFINAKQHFSGVPAGAWTYTIGGYRVAERWLKGRRGRRLSLDEIQMYRRIILALAETLRLRREIDAAMPPFPWRVDKL